MSSKRKKWARINRENSRIALKRMDILFREAEISVRSSDMEAAKSYVALARRIGMRYNARIPREWKLRFCKNCGSFLVPTVNCTVRVGRGRIVRTCGSCGAYMRIPYLREIKEKRLKRARAGKQDLLEVSKNRGNAGDDFGRQDKEPF